MGEESSRRTLVTMHFNHSISAADCMEISDTKRFLYLSWKVKNRKCM